MNGDILSRHYLTTLSSQQHRSRPTGDGHPNLIAQDYALECAVSTCYSNLLLENYQKQVIR